MIRAVFFLSAFLVALTAQAQVNKCIGTGGKVTYSQDPCPANTKSSTMTHDVPPAPQTSAPAPSAEKAGAAKSAAPKTAAEQEQAFRKRQQDQEKAAKEAQQKAAQSEQKQDNCRNARERLATFEAGGRITRLNAAGERYYLDDAQIDQEREAARLTVKQACN
jgi:predicted lipid-binding transport protein (Tim44 family)